MEKTWKENNLLREKTTLSKRQKAVLKIIEQFYDRLNDLGSVVDEIENDEDGFLDCVYELWAQSSEYVIPGDFVDDYTSDNEIQIAYFSQELVTPEFLEEAKKYFKKFK